MTIRLTSSTIIAAAMATTSAAFMYKSISKKGGAGGAGERRGEPSSTTTTTNVKSTLLTSPPPSSSSSTKDQSIQHHKTNEKTFLFVGDIGGTNTRLAIYETTNNDINNDEDKKKQPLYVKEYVNEKYITDSSKSFENDIFLPFLSEWNDTYLSNNNDINSNHSNINSNNNDKDMIKHNLIACFAVAGPVQENKAKMTNIENGNKSNPTKKLSIEIDGTSIEQNTNGLLSLITKCTIVNDFIGQGYGLLDLDLNKEVIALSPNACKKVNKTGPIACVGAGTGLGECFLTTSSLHEDEGYECYPSEGGHVDFVPRDDVQMKLLTYLKGKFGEKHRVSVERVVSGKGLANVYRFLSETYPDKVDPKIHCDFMLAGTMQGKIVGENANSKKGEEVNVLCRQAMEIMMSAYGAEVGNCAMKFIPTGGLYVSGGLTPKNIKFIQGDDSPFMKAFRDKGRMSSLVDSVPLFAVMVEDLGLRGARVCAMREYKKWMINRV